MHIKKLKLQHFRNIQDSLEILFEEKHTIVFGANGAGKSNIPMGIAFVLNCDVGFLGSGAYVDFINEAHKQAVPETASCTVRLVLKRDKGRDIALQRTLKVNSQSVYMVDKRRVTEVQYKTQLRALHLQATAMLFPQRFASPAVMSGPYGYGPFLESLVEFFNELEFSAEEEKQLQKSHRTVPQLKKRIRMQQKIIDQIERLEPRAGGNTEDLEERINTAERLLVLAELWKVDESRKKHVLKLEELRATDVESRLNDAENEIEIVQNEISVIQGKLDDLYQTEAQENTRSEELRSQKKHMAQLSASRDRLQKLISEARSLISTAGGSRTEVKENLLREIQQLEVSNTRGVWLCDKMKAFDERFQGEHPQESEELKSIENELDAQHEKRERMQQSLVDIRRRKSRAKEEKLCLKDKIKALERDKSYLGAKLEIENSFLRKHDDIVDGVQTMMTRKQNHLSSLRRYRASSIQRSMAATRNEFELRCLISGICEYFADDLPTRPVHGLLRDLIKPKNEAHARAFHGFLGKRLDSIVVKNQHVQALVGRLLEGDSQYKAPRTPIIVLPKEGDVSKRSRIRISSYRKRGRVPLADTWVVSKKYKGDQRMSKRVLRLIKVLASDTLFCSNDALAMEISSERRGTLDGKGSTVRAVTSDGTVCSNSGTLTFSSSHQVSDSCGSDGLRRTQELEREIRAMEGFLNKEPMVALLLHTCLQHRLRVSINRTKDLLDSKNSSLKEAVSKLKQVESAIRNGDEVSRNFKDELEILRGSGKLVELRRERTRINLMRIQYIKDLEAVDKFSHSEISDALKQNRRENLLDQDYHLNTLIEICEEDRENEWNSLMQRAIQTSGRARLEEIIEQLDSALRANEETEQELTEVNTRRSNRGIEKKLLMESLDKFTTRLSELFRTTKKLSRDAATNSLNQRRQILSLRKLQRRRRDLIRELSDEAAYGAQDDDDDIEDNDESSPEVEINEERLLDPGRPVDYTELPGDAKASERAMVGFVKSIRSDLSGFRLEKMNRLARTNPADVATARTLESGLRSKKEALTQSKETLKEELERIKTAEKKKMDFNARRNELLKDLYEKLPNEVAAQYAKLSNHRITMDLRKPSDDEFFGSEVRFHRSGSGSDRASHPRGGEVTLLLSIVLAVQEIFNVPSLILDEIDARTSSATSKQLHRILQEHATSKQVICISHKPQNTPETGVMYIGLIWCHVSLTTKALYFDPEVTFTSEDLNFRGKLTPQVVHYILSSNTEDTPPGAAEDPPMF